MQKRTASSRRAFIAVAGAALSAPVAAAAAGSSAWLPPSGGSDPLEARLARLEDLNAIRTLNLAFARHVTAGAHEELAALAADPSAVLIPPGLCGITFEAFGEHDVIDIAPDGQTATAVLHGTVHTETPLESCPLVDMARQQGGGVVSQVESGVFENAYVRRDGGWKILTCRRT